MGGPILGFASLRQLLVQDGTYEEYCTLDEATVCEERELALQMIFICGYAAAIGARLPLGHFIDFVPTLTVTFLLGMFLDSCGPRASAVTGALLAASGAGLMAASGPDFDGYVMGSVLIGVGGVVTLPIT